MSGLDFTKLARGSASESATEPRRIFSALPSKAAKYGYARDVQSEVWQAWHERRRERDVIIKMNTGGGKTVVGLIALKSALNEGGGPAAYITPDVYLAEQVRAEAEGLGLETTIDADSARFRQGHAILIANIYRLFNGLSVFGVKGSARPMIELGTVLIDDAHACLATVEEQFTLTLSAEHPGYAPLLDVFGSELAAQSEPALRDIREGDLSAVLPVPFWAWAAKQKDVLKILHPHRRDDELKFVWPLISGALPLCRVAVSAGGIEISPPCPPVEMIPSFARARRRIYLTATLADDSVLVTHFAADPDLVRKPVTPHSADDLGDRMILTPSETFPGLQEDTVRDFLRQQAETRNVVVIVPSWARARIWQPIADAVHGADTLQTGLETLRDGHVGLVVLVNKYDGIDLPGDACRILVLDGLPEALGILDRLDTVALEGSDSPDPAHRAGNGSWRALERRLLRRRAARQAIDRSPASAACARAIQPSDESPVGPLRPGSRPAARKTVQHPRGSPRAVPPARRRMGGSQPRRARRARVPGRKRAVARRGGTARGIRARRGAAVHRGSGTPASCTRRHERPPL